MSQKLFTTPLAAVGMDGANAGEADEVHDFLLLCKEGNIAEAVHALYYLPHNYKLMVVAEAPRLAYEDAAAWMESDSLKGRVRFGQTETANGQRSPFSFADAIILDDEDVAEIVKSADAPYVVVSATADPGITVSGAHGFTVQSGNPEALASAILNLSRKS